MTLPVIISFKTYRGEVPISPKMMPNAMIKPALVTLLNCLLTMLGWFLNGYYFPNVAVNSIKCGKMGLKNPNLSPFIYTY